jgi:hypothetical protein
LRYQLRETRCVKELKIVLSVRSKKLRTWREMSVRKVSLSPREEVDLISAWKDE